MDKPTPLNPTEIEIALQRLPGWALDDTKISKEFKFKDFIDSLSFLNRLVPFFEVQDHHPDVHIFYSRMKFELSTHSVGGKVTDRDVEVAKRIEHEYTGSK